MFSFYKPPKPKDVKPHEAYGGRAEIVEYDIPYVPGMEDNPKLKLDLYTNEHKGPWPAAVLLHGGAWMIGDKDMDNMVYISKVLAANGYVVFNANYRLAPKFKMKHQAEDAMAAVLWVKEHAAEYGADPNRIGVLGGSAGGQLSALIAWAHDVDYFTPTGKQPGSYDYSVKAAALYFPVLDVDRTLRDMMKFTAPIGARIVTGLGGEKYRQALKHLSPKYHIKPHVTPTIFLCGDKDVFKLYPQVVGYEEELRNEGVDTKLFTARGHNHGFTFHYWLPETRESVMEVVAFFDKYLK